MSIALAPDTKSAVYAPDNLAFVDTEIQFPPLAWHTTETAAAAYYYLVPVATNQWDNTFKFIGTADLRNVDILVMMQPAAYTHQVRL